MIFGTKDEIDFIFKTYGKVLQKELGTKDITLFFYPNIEKYVDKVKKVETGGKYSKYSGFKMTFLQDFSFDEKQKLSDINILEIEGIKFFKIVTPFLRANSYDFCVAKRGQAEAIIDLVNRNKELVNKPNLNMPIIGIDTAMIQKEVIDFLMNEEFRNFCKTRGIKLKRGLCFESPPGNGKSSIIKILKAKAEEHGIDFHYFKNPKEFQDSMGEFYSANKKIFVFEDFDAILRERDDTGNSANTMLSTVLNLLDGVEEITNVVTIFTTNKIDLFDTAFLRPGRIDKIFKFAPPSKENVIEFLNAYIPEAKDLHEELIAEIVKKKDKISYAILKGICDDINIDLFNKVPLNKERVFELINTKFKSANKNKDVKEKGFGFNVES
jgi:hypothetical protein